MLEKRMYLPVLVSVFVLSLLFGGHGALAEAQPHVSTQQFTPITNLSGDVNAVAIDGGTLFVGDGGNVRIYDIADPSSPVAIAVITVSADLPVLTLTYSDGYIHAMTQSTDHIYDLSDLSAPELIGRVGLANTASPIAVSSNEVYLTRNSPRLVSFGIIQDSSVTFTRGRLIPQLVSGGVILVPSSELLYSEGFSRRPDGGQLITYRGVAYDNDLKYVMRSGDGEGAAYVPDTFFDVYSDTQPITTFQLTNNYDGYSFDVIDGVYYEVDDGIDLYNVSTFSHDLIGGYTLPIPTATIASYAVNGDLIYYADSTGQLVALDASVVSSISSIASTPTTGSVKDIAAQNDLVFLAQGEDGLAILQLGTVEEPPVVACGLPGLSSSYWDVIYGSSVETLTSDPRFPDNPTSESVLGNFQAPSDVGNYYGKRFVGYIVPPISGDYRFHMASDDASELWLSSNGLPDNALQIASVPAWTFPLQWDKYPSQQSNLVTLAAGELYYVEALFKEDGGNDHFAVGWETPGNEGVIEIVAEDYLCQIGDGSVPLSAEFTPTPTSGTIPLDVVFNASASSGEIVSYDWDLGNGSSASGITATETYTVDGDYTVTLTVTDEDGDTASTSRIITAIKPIVSCDVHGLSREFWYQVDGNEIYWLTDLAAYPNNPSMRDTISDFESLPNKDFYGSRIRGYIEPTMTGDYTFWLASDDNGELWLSNSANPADKQLIASVSSWTAPSAYDWYEEQQSETIELVAGQRYFVEALHKEGGGGDHLSVAWAQPGQERTLIDSSYLCPDPEIEGLPVANVSHDFDGSSAPATINFDGSTSFDPNGFIVSYEWEFSDGGTASGALAAYTFNDPGAYGVRLTVTDNNGNADNMDVTIEIGSGDYSCGSDALLQERWFGVDGALVSDLLADPRYPDAPDEARILFDRFETDTDTAEYYGSRMRGYVIPKVSADYTFWLASDDQSVFYLSTDDDPANMAQIASVPEWTPQHEYDWYPTQQSAPISLVAGESYYVEILHKEGFGGDHVTVAWERDATTRAIIDAEYLCPFETDAPVDRSAARSGRAPLDFSRQVAETRLAQEFPVALYDDAFVVLMRDSGLRSRVLSLQVWADSLLANGETIPQTFVDEAESVVMAAADLGSADFSDHLLANWDSVNLAQYVNQPARDAYDAANSFVPTSVALGAATTDVPHAPFIVTLTLLAAMTSALVWQRKRHA